MIYRQNLLLGALLITLSEFMFASMGALVKQVSQMGTPSEITVFVRNLMGFFLMLPMMLHGKRDLLKTDCLHLHLLRGVSGVAAMYCFFYALAHLPLANGLLLKMTAPLFMPLIALLWLAERLRLQTIFAISLGFAGVLLVLGSGSEATLPALVGILGGVLAALAKTSVRRLGRSEPNLRVVAYFSLIGLVVSSLPLAWAWQPPDPDQWVLLVSIGVLGTLGQLLMTRGYAIAPSGQVSPFTYFSVIFGTLYGYLFWQEIPHHTFVAGALLIALAGILTLQPKFSLRA